MRAFSFSVPLVLVLVIAVFNMEAAAAFVVHAEKSGLPDNPGLVFVDDCADEACLPGDAVMRSVAGCGQVSCDLKMGRLPAYESYRRDGLGLCLEPGRYPFPSLAVSFGKISSDFFYDSCAIPPVCNSNPYVSMAVVMFERPLNKSYFHPRTVACDEFSLLANSMDCCVKRSLLNGSPSQGQSEPCDKACSNRGNRPVMSLKKLSDIQDKERTYMVSGALFIAGIFALFANILKYWYEE